MNAMKILVAALFALFAAGASLAGGDDALLAAFEKQNLLKAELSAAQTGKFYVVLDLKNSSFLLKNRGRIFKEWKALSAEYIGTAIPLVSTTLTKRDAKEKPKRFEVIPEVVDENGLTADGKPPKLPDPLEVVDMPTRYNLVFPSEVTVSISVPYVETGKKMDDYKEKFDRYKESFMRNLKLPFLLKEKKEKKEDFGQINLVMAPEDAKALYWAFPEGTPTIFTTNALR